MTVYSIDSEDAGRMVEYPSLSQPGVLYRAYPDQGWCNCPGFRSAGWCGHVNCRHCKGHGNLDNYPHWNECSVCSGTGRVA